MANLPPKNPTPGPGSRPPSTPRRAGAVVPRKPPPRRSGFWVARAARLLTEPRAEWPSIAGEQMTPRSVYRGFLVPMAALGPLAATLGTILSGERSSLAGLYTVSALGAVAGGALEYALNLGAMWVFGLVIEQLAQAFEGRPNRVQALKLAAFGATPYWIGGLLSIVPKLAPVGVLAGLWSLRLYALGLGPLMGVPDERLKAYTLVVGIVGVVLVLLVSALLLGVSS